MLSYSRLKTSSLQRSSPSLKCGPGLNLHKMLLYTMFRLHRITRVKPVPTVPVPPVPTVPTVPVPARVRQVRAQPRSVAIISMRGIMVHQAKSCGACGRK